MAGPGPYTGRTITTSTPQFLSLQSVSHPQLLKAISSEGGSKGLQLVYKLPDGKTYQLMPVQPNNMKVLNSLKQAPDLKVITQNNNTVPPRFEENYTKFIHIARPAEQTSSSLPKFQQAFGKPSSFASTTSTSSDPQPQQVFVVSTMTGNTSTTASLGSPITVVSVPMSVNPTIMTTSVTSTLQRALTQTNSNVRLIKQSITVPTTQASHATLASQGSKQDDKSKGEEGCVTSVGEIVTTSAGVTTVPMRLALPIVQRTASHGIQSRVTPILVGQRVLLTPGMYHFFGYF